MFESRFKFLDELGKMGADVRVIESTAIINGVERLVGARVNATDLRAGAAMVIAALMAEGTTEISGVSYTCAVSAVRRKAPQARRAGRADCVPRGRFLKII